MLALLRENDERAGRSQTTAPSGPEHNLKGAGTQMRTIIRATLATAVATLVMAAPAAADTIYPNGGSTFDPDAQGWQPAASGCRLLNLLPDLQIPLLCTTVNEYRSTGGNPGGALFTTFSSVANALGVIEGTGTWRSPDFTITSTPSGAPVTGAQFSLQRKASITGLINAGGKVTFTASLVRTDVTPNTRKTLVTQTITQDDPAFVTVPAQNVPAADLQANGRYHIDLAATFTTALLQAAQGTVGIAYDNVSLRVQDGTVDGNVAPAVFTLPATGVTESLATPTARRGRTPSATARREPTTPLRRRRASPRGRARTRCPSASRS